MVSAALPEDEDSIFQMLLGLHEENGIFQVDEGRVRSFIREATEHRGGVIGVIRGDSGLEASVGMTLDQWWYTTDWCLSERWLYVLPEFRRENHARRLVDYAKHCAATLTVPLQMGIMSTQRTAAKERLYARQLTPIGGLFMWADNQEVKTGGRQDKYH